MANMTRWAVLKYGGTSVSTVSNWEGVTKVLKARIKNGLSPVVVCSALSGISDAFEDLLKKVLTDEHEPVIKKIKQKHRALAKDMGLDADVLLAEYFEKLVRYAKGASLVREVTPRLHARVMSLGELMSTTLGAAFLNKSGLKTAWHDARDSLVADERKRIAVHQCYLSATCCYDSDDSLCKSFLKYKADVVVTQGFIARNDEGHTVLLGRGGSDTSAAYFAAKLGAEQCEIWTDVPGIYSANPRQIPSARLLKFLDYDEAQEITSMGAKVLHPRCIAPLKENKIPIHILCTTHPEMEGTVITTRQRHGKARVKAISSKSDITLISMETVGMWQQVGFLADIGACFKKHGLSIDLVSTSQTNVTVSLDNIANALNPEVLENLMEDLQEICMVRKIGPCASVSLVGRNIRAILHQLGPVLKVFEESMIHLVTQAANDLNFTFVVDEKNAEKVINELHQLLFDGHLKDRLLGPTWSETFEKKKDENVVFEDPWWILKREKLLKLAMGRTPLYVYDEQTLLTRAAQLKKFRSVDRVFYSIKANNFKPVLELFFKRNLGFECVSPGEVAYLFETFPKIDPKRILFTPNFAPGSDYAYGLEKGVHVTLDNMFPLEKWPELFRGREVFVRIDPGQGRGHHEFVRTAGSKSKFGVSIDQFGALLKLAAENDTTIVGLHAHTGSGILTPDNWKETALILAKLAEETPSIKYLDLGGGLGVVEKAGQTPLDLAQVDKTLRQVKAAYPNLDLWIEPGRFLVAEAGVLLTSVTQTKRKAEYNYVGVDTGFNSLIRPVLYGAYHQIANLSQYHESGRMEVEVVGPICETGDVLGHDRRIVPPKEKDIILVATAGAYGHVMSSNYNMRKPADQVMLPKE